MAKWNPVPTEAIVGTPGGNAPPPKSFIALHHWCKPWSSIETFEPNAWEPDANGLGRVFVNGYFSPRTPEFLRLAIESLHQLGDDIESTKLGELADDASLKSLVRAVERRCESGAVSKGESPQGWFERPIEGLSVPLPPFPLRSSDDVCRWLKAILDDSGRRTAKQRQQPAHSLNLWTTYRQARFWIDQERSDIPLPLVPGKFDFAMKWWGHRGTRSARSNGDFPECGSAEQALSDLLRLIESPAPPGGGGEPNGTASDKQSEAVFGQVGLADVTKRVASLEQGAKKRAKKLTKTEKIRNQRIKFCCPQRRKKSPDTWNEIYNAYVEKYPDDKTASPDTLLHSHERNCPKCLKDKS